MGRFRRREGGYLRHQGHIMLRDQGLLCTERAFTLVLASVESGGEDGYRVHFATVTFCSIGSINQDT